jgi:RNA-splicing ligase RtcB
VCIAHANPNCPIVNLAEKAVVDTQAIGQLEQTAHTLPGLIHAVGQPDLHPGNRFPIGAVFVSEGWIHPPLIGGDIGCGMAWYKVESLSRRQVDGDKGKKISENLRGLEGPWQSQRAREIWLTKGTECYSAGLE